MAPRTVKSKALDTTLQQLKAMFGDNAVIHLSDVPAHNVIPTGIPELDTALGIGGIPKGRIVEIHGPEAAGKSALALHIAKQVPATLYIDADHGLTPANYDSVNVLSVDTLEDALNACKIAAPAFDVIIIDTVAALPTKMELTEDIGEYPQQPQAKILSSALPRLVGLLAKHGCTLILVNQIRENPGIYFGNPEKATGGRALKHFATVCLEVRRLENIRTATAIGKAETVGQRVRISIQKNKCASPFRSATVDLFYGSGLSPTKPPSA